MVEWSLQVTGLLPFYDRPIEALSGGQRQRVWIAMALAQETELLLLDEPTTYLDLAHQLEILQLLEKLNQEGGRTILMVIHDLNHAARFAHHMVALNRGAIVKEGAPHEVMTSEVLKKVFQIDAEIILDPRTGKPVCLTYDLLKKEENLFMNGVISWPFTFSLMTNVWVDSSVTKMTFRPLAIPNISWFGLL